MNAVRYESPKFDFQELRLMERVADDCWGLHYGWYDADGDGTVDAGEKVDISTKTSCAAVEAYLVEYINDTFKPIPKITGNDVKTNTKSSIVHASNS